MTLLAELSSAVGDRTQKANLAVAEKVKANVALLTEMVEGLSASNIKLAGDAAEIFTMTAQDHPAAVAPYARFLIPCLERKDKRVRWEATHALALVAREAPTEIKRALPKLQSLVAVDESMIVRGYALQAIGEYAATSKPAAQSVHEFLVESLSLWKGEHAHLALEALGKAAEAAPSQASEVREIAQGYEKHENARVKKAAKTVLKKLRK